jgi:hypothetical protein
MRAQALYRSALVEMTPENGAGLLACSLLMVFFSLGLQFIPGLAEPDEPLDNFIRILCVLKASSRIFGRDRLWHVDNPLRKSRTLEISERLSEAFESHHLDSSLDNLELLNKACTQSEEIRSMYERTIQNLRRYYSGFPRHPLDLSQVVWWLRSLSSEYMTMLEQKQPMALVILAHWCASVHKVPHRWYMSRWAGKVVSLIACTVGPVWKHGLHWPLQEIGNVRERQGA